MRVTLFSLLLLPVVFIPACSEGSAGPSTEIAAEIGPEGGELVAPQGSLLAGVRLRIPAGALATKTRVRIDAATDPTPLPETAERVGVRLRIEPADAKLAKPAELTTTVDPSLFGTFDQTPADCRVWFRTGEAWSRLEQKSSTDSTVTVKLPSFGRAAAGIVLRTTPSACGILACQPLPVTIPIELPCTNATGFCDVKLPEVTRSIASLPSLTVHDGSVYFPNEPGTDKVSILRYSMSSGAITSLGETADSHGIYRGRVAVDPDGSAWLGQEGFGNVVYRTTGLPSKFDFGGTEAEGSFVARGKLVRSKRSPATSERRLFDGTNDQPFGGSTSRALLFLPQASGSTLLAVGGELDVFDILKPLSVERMQLTQGIASTAAASLKNEGFAVFGRFLANQPPAVVWRRQIDAATHALEEQSFPMDDTIINGLAFDDDDDLYGFCASKPEIYIFKKDGSMSVLPLTTAPITSPIYAAMLPLAIRSIPGKREVFVVTRGAVVARNEFHVIRKAMN